MENRRSTRPTGVIRGSLCILNIRPSRSLWSTRSSRSRSASTTMLRSFHIMNCSPS